MIQRDFLDRAVPLNGTKKVLEFCITDITARTLGETHVSTDDLT